MPRTVIATPGWINGMDFGPDGFIYAPQWSQRKVVRIDPETGAMTDVASAFDSLAAAVKFDSKGQLHALEQVPANVVRLDVQTGARSRRSAPVSRCCPQFPPGASMASRSARQATCT